MLLSILITASKKVKKSEKYFWPGKMAWKFVTFQNIVLDQFERVLESSLLRKHMW